MDTEFRASLKGMLDVVQVPISNEQVAVCVTHASGHNRSMNYGNFICARILRRT